MFKRAHHNRIAKALAGIRAEVFEEPLWRFNSVNIENPRTSIFFADAWRITAAFDRASSNPDRSIFSKKG